MIVSTLAQLSGNRFSAEEALIPRFALVYIDDRSVVLSTSVNAILGFVFLGLSVITTYLMFQYWGYPYDEVEKKSSAPQWKMNIHRGFGFAYLIVYIILMVQMVPRLWEYQVEFPARTVAHIIFAITIGVILLVKLSILRWFRHFEEAMLFLGIALMLCTFILTGLSLPPVFKERALASAGPGGGAFSEQNQARVRALLPSAGFVDGVDFDKLATENSLRAGREILLTSCTHCHDLKTVIAKPRTPSDWVRTVKRMAEKPTLGDSIEPVEQHQVSSYLIAITPDLQKSSKAMRAAATTKAETGKALKAVVAADAGAPKASESSKPSYDGAQAKSDFEETCSQCHETTDVDSAPPADEAELNELIERMVENGMEAEKEQLARIKEYMRRTYIKK